MQRDVVMTIMCDVEEQAGLLYRQQYPARVAHQPHHHSTPQHTNTAHNTRAIALCQPWWPLHQGPKCFPSLDRGIMRKLAHKQAAVDPNGRVSGGRQARKQKTHRECCSRNKALACCLECCWNVVLLAIRASGFEDDVIAYFFPAPRTGTPFFVHAGPVNMSVATSPTGCFV